MGYYVRHGAVVMYCTLFIDVYCEHVMLSVAVYCLGTYVALRYC